MTTVVEPLISYMPRGPGILLLGPQHVPEALYGHLAWGAAYLGGAIMSEQIAELRAAGAHDVYLWAHPDHWLVTNFVSNVEHAERLCHQHGLSGFIVDPEMPGISATQATAFGGRLKSSVQSGLSVGLASYAGYSRLGDFADGCDRAVWGLCEIFNRDSNDAATFNRWLRLFRRLFGRAMPIVVSTVLPVGAHSGEIATPEGYDAYLAKIPSSGGYASFGVANTAQEFMYTRLAAWRRANLIDSAMWGIGLPTIAHLPVLYSLMVLAFILLGAYLFYLIRRSL